MECTWNAALLQRADELPSELIEIIRHGSNVDYLSTLTRIALTPSYTYTLFAHCQNLFAHVCADLRRHGSLPQAIATLGRVVPFAPWLVPYAQKLLSGESYDNASETASSEISMYLLGVFRLLRSDPRTFQPLVDTTQITKLLGHGSPPVVYLAIRILQILLDGADGWFEQMVRTYLGPDRPDSGIEGAWDDKTIDYRFLTLWEDELSERVHRLLQSTLLSAAQTTPRRIPVEDFHPSTCLVGGVLLAGDSSKLVPDELITTTTIFNNLHRTALALKSSRPILLSGLAGSGKTLLLRHIAQKLGKLEQMVTLHLNEQSDAKLLVGVYTTGDTPGSFSWKPGVLTTAVQEGRWICIEDLDRAPQEILGALLPLVERGQLAIPSRKQTIHAQPGFRIIATVRTAHNHRGEETKALGHMLGRRHWQDVHIDIPPIPEQHAIASSLYPSTKLMLPQFIALFERLQAMRRGASSAGQSKVGILRPISPRDLMKWCSRVAGLLQGRATFSSSDMDDIFLEAVDCFIGALPAGSAKSNIAAVIAEELRIDPQRRDFLVSSREAKYDLGKTRIAVGRYSLPRSPTATKIGAGQGSFSTNPHTSRMLERVAAAVINKEPLLLVGETGVGKTTAVQHLASHLGKKLVPFNLSQQSEIGDLLGGFKPVNTRLLMVPLKEVFDDLFPASFSMSKNQQFVDLLGKQMSRGNWKAVCKLFHQALRMVDQQRSLLGREGEAPVKKRKIDSKKVLDSARWDDFAAKVHDMEHRLAAGNEAFAFSFVEGNIVKAVRSGDWILLDEINLASPDTLESIADILDPTSPSILLTEAGNVERIEAHPDFRIFAAMNPATDVGKKDLPPGIRSRFTELYVESPDKDLKSLQSIVRVYLRTETAADQAIPLDVSTLYQQIVGLSDQNRLVDGAGQQPHFSLRTLTRTLSYARHIAPSCNLRRALYEGFQMSFMTFLDTESSKLVQPLIEQHLFGKRTNVKSELQRALRKPNDGHGYIQGYPNSKHWVRQGENQLQEQPHYIITPFIRSNLENLVRASSTRQFPVLIQGPTSSGKTSMIEYLAKRTGHQFVRINNHEHTDLQEYLGTYVSGADGKLQFQEGLLVKALREGHWIVLDELNLAPTDVLEALNRLLDDNRELLIPETQEVVRPHENFMLFATQNPAGLYGGRKTLSRAFRNRFLELHFDDIPIEELQEILHKRTQLPESRCKRIVTVYRELSVLRQENRIFEQKSFATLRDLFRWALRTNDTIEQLATNGFMLLAERVRKPEEREAVKTVIERVMSMNGARVTIQESSLYSDHSLEVRQYQQHAKHRGAVWTRAMRRLYTLVARAVQNNEPVLLVGETGCGKTTVCQMLADALRQDLHIINAHQNTETGDLIGSQRPVRNRAAIESRLRTLLLASPPLRSFGMTAAESTDTLLDVYTKAVQSLPGESKPSYVSSSHHLEIQSHRTRLNALFEWADGSLVHAMRNGAFFLLDEISLADDSVLERINSVLEPSRSILLAEKGGIDSSVSAAEGFQFFATMNPGGDYGKRELSPALRNRFTEIWVPALSDLEDVVQIVRAKLASPVEFFADAMVAFAHWFRTQYNTSATSSVSIRDVLAWCEFVNTFPGEDASAAVVHGAAMVYIDTLGANPAGLMTLTGRSIAAERRKCLEELSGMMAIEAQNLYDTPAVVHVHHGHVAFGQFTIARSSSAVSGDQSFSFDAPTTQSNAMRVVRAMQLAKPVMLEGSPGVGKTALVTAISQAAGVPLTRINLSEQTDLMDLFGSDTPVQGAEAGTFAWRDAPFLRAMKAGEWVLLDEMNLASQSVLEGLNACLDHRGEVFVPEIGQTFARHPNFRLFAAQNPHHQGGGRKGLPASFVNRFTVVYADAFGPDDLKLICHRSFPTAGSETIDQAVVFVDALESQVVQQKRYGSQGGPWEFNLRDIARWLSLVGSDQGLLTAGTARDFVDLLFAQRFRSVSDRQHLAQTFVAVYGNEHLASDMYSSISQSTLQLGLGALPRETTTAVQSGRDPTGNTAGKHLQALQALMVAVQRNWPILLSGTTGTGKSAMITDLAFTVGALVTTFAMNAETDAMDLVGGYEQADPYRESLQLLENLCLYVDGIAKSSLVKQSREYIELAADLRSLKSAATGDPTVMVKLIPFLRDNDLPGGQELLAAIEESSIPMDKARFVWVDGILVDALEQGRWLVLDNANLCSPSVIDRLNSLLEPNGTLIINEHVAEDGTPRIIQPHPRFRIFLTVDPRYGELSRAMRNRTLEVHLLDNGDSIGPTLTPLHPESAMARFHEAKALGSVGSVPDLKDHASRIMEDRLGLSDVALTERFNSQLANGLYEGLPNDLALHVAQHDSNTLKLDESPDQLMAFYELATSRKQVSADFACVQSLHPLNNQPLVQQSDYILTEASRLAFLRELRCDVLALAKTLQSLQTDRTVVSKLMRLERARSTRNKASAKVESSKTLRAIENTVRLVIAESDRLSKQQSGSYALQSSLQWLFGGLRHLSGTLTLQDIDQAQISACLAIARHSRLVEQLDADSKAFFLAAGRHLTVFGTQEDGEWGAECVPLWEAFRPLTPPTLEQLDELLRLEQIASHFDDESNQFRLPVQVIAELRQSFALALDRAKAGGANINHLATKLESMLPPERIKSSDDHSVNPHFVSVFRVICQHFSLLRLSIHSFDPMELASVHSLALQPTHTFHSPASGNEGRQGSVHAIFELLNSFSYSTALQDQAPSDGLHIQLLKTLVETNVVPVSQLSLLESEVQVLGRLFARSTDAVVQDDLPALHRGLWKLTYELVIALSETSQDISSRSTYNAFRLSMANQDRAGLSNTSIEPGMALEQRFLASTVHWLLNSPVATNSRTGAAGAWLSFALAGLRLYVPANPFDPALEPLTRRRVHDEIVKNLTDRLRSMQMFNDSLTGVSSTLRSTILERDIALLGPSPNVPAVCRPAASEMAQLQLDFDGLRRMLVNIDPEAGVELDVGSITNLRQIRARLSERYRAYTDMTTPVVGFIDCLLISQHLATEFNADSVPLNQKSNAGMLIPFCNASLSTWTSDYEVIHGLPTAASQEETLLWLAAVAARSSSRPLSQAEPSLRAQVNQQFARMYEQWRTELGRDQREAAANSSLYRYSGDQDMQDEPSEEQLEALFPSAEDGTLARSLETTNVRTQDRAAQITALHNAVFAGSDLTAEVLLGLLNQQAQLTSARSGAESTRTAVPMLLLQLQSLSASLKEIAYSHEQRYNIYSSPNVAEVRKLLGLLRTAEKRFGELHEAWPDHATPGDVLQLCRQITKISYAEPLVRFLPTVEKLHATIAEWQKVASREYTAVSIYEAVTDLIVRWRQLELSSWAGLFDEENRNAKTVATSWWFIAYETIVAATEGLPSSGSGTKAHVVGLLEALEQFFYRSGLGEYEARLEMLRNFEADLRHRAVKSETFELVRKGLSNFIAYYSHFVKPIQDALSSGRLALEKGVKEVIQLASWKDRNIETLRQSAKASHRKLFKCVRKYRALLAQPVASLLQAGVPNLTITARHQALFDSHVSLPVNNEQPTLATRIQPWDTKPARFSNLSATIDLMRTKSKPLSGPERSAPKMADFLLDLQESMAELQKATPKLLTKKTEPAVKHLKTRKRRLLADVLKKIRLMGFQHNISQDIFSQQASLPHVLANLEILNAKDVSGHIDAAQYHLHRFLALMPSVREGSRKHSEDLTPAESARCAAYLESMMSTSIAQQRRVCHQIRTSCDLRHTINLLEAFADCQQPSIIDINASAARPLDPKTLAVILTTASRLVQIQAELGSTNYGTISGYLLDVASKIESICYREASFATLPSAVTSSQHCDAQAAFEDSLQHLRTVMPDWVLAHPELGPIVKQVELWLLRTTGSSAPLSNRADFKAMTEWTQEALACLDLVLVSVQRLDTALSSSKNNDEQTWVLRNQELLTAAWIALDPSTLSKRVGDLLSSLREATAGDSNCLSDLSKISQSILPLFRMYGTICERVSSAYTNLHAETNRMGYVLASTFVNLARDGFCTPPDKQQEGKQESGDVETGTGLGEGEGGEDISKDIGADEDLSELAQEGKKNQEKKDEIEDEQDAVDMADQEMEGELGDPETGSQAEDEGDDQSQNDDLEEETGDVGDLDDGAVDEKMWDDGKNEQDNDKEADSGKGTAHDEEKAAAAEGEKEEGEGGDEQEVEEAAAGADEEEDVSRKEPDAADPHMQEQENLDLPEDINMDGDKSDEDELSGGESMAGDDLPPDGAEEDERMSDAGSQVQEADEDGGRADEEEVGEDAMDTQEAGEGAEEEQDVEKPEDPGLLQDREQHPEEAPAEGEIAGEEGGGQDQQESKPQATDGVAGEADEEEPEPASGAQQQSGAQSGADESQNQDSADGADQSSTAQSQWPYKQLGDVLDEWYKQQRQIEAPQQSDAADAEQQQQRDVDMANATFEHLPDADAEADTQALGTASADQSGALNEETGLPVNEDKAAEDVPFQDAEEGADDEEAGPQDQQEPHMEPSDQLTEPRNAKAFVADNAVTDDVEMSDDAGSLDEDDVEDMDGQLLNTHISHEEASEEMTLEEARRAWAEHESSTRNLALILTEHLRLILQPTQATKMRGDFRTGKRLNIKRIIPYIASSYKRDKIWMRRSIPSKRSYQIMLAIDDSKSMDESDSKALAFETLALVSKSMAMLEVGELCVLGFGDDVKVAHDFSTPFTSEAGADVFKSFSFSQSRTNVRKMLAESLELFRAARLKAVGSSSDLWQLQIIISDGVCEDHPSIRQLVRQAYEERIMIVFVVVDSAAQKAHVAGAPKQSIVDLQTAEFSKDTAGEMQLKMVKYLDTFPFKYYLIVRDVQELPGVLAGALRQWFAEVVDSGV